MPDLGLSTRNGEDVIASEFFFSPPLNPRSSRSRSVANCWYKLCTRLVSRSVVVLSVPVLPLAPAPTPPTGFIGVPSGVNCVAENGWYDAVVVSAIIRFLSWFLGRLNDVWSCFVNGFCIACMAPLLSNFLATSLASLASAGRFGINGFSGSCFGAFRACNAFF